MMKFGRKEGKGYSLGPILATVAGKKFSPEQVMGASVSNPEETKDISRYKSYFTRVAALIRICIPDSQFISCSI
jgi:hypothetical protein